MDKFFRDHNRIEDNLWGNLDTLRDRGYAKEAYDVIVTYLDNKYDLELEQGILVGSAGGYNLSHNADSSYVRNKHSGDKHDQPATDLDIIALLNEENGLQVTELQELFYFDDNSTSFDDSEIDDFIENALMPYYDQEQIDPPTSLSHLFNKPVNKYRNERKAVKESLSKICSQKNYNPDNEVMNGLFNLLYPQIEVNPRFLQTENFLNKILGALDEFHLPEEKSEGVIYPSVDGEKIKKNPHEFLGTFMKGYTLLDDSRFYWASQEVSESEVTEVLEDITQADESLFSDEFDLEAETQEYLENIPIENLIDSAIHIANKYDEGNKVWDKLNSRLAFKEITMNENIDLGRWERTISNSKEFHHYLDQKGHEFSESNLNTIVQDARGFVKKVLAGESEYASEGLNENLNAVNSDEASNIVDNDSTRVRFDSEGTQTNFDVNGEKTYYTAEAEAYRKARRILEEHPDTKIVRENRKNKIEIGHIPLEINFEKMVRYSADRLAGKK